MLASKEVEFTVLTFLDNMSVQNSLEEFNYLIINLIRNFYIQTDLFYEKTVHDYEK